jgi:SAM-dependent methyltransferase
MEHLLDLSSKSGWRTAVEQTLPKPLQAYTLSPDRAAFQDVLAIPDGSHILDLGAGMGGICTELAKRYRVTALEGVWERARFIAIRKEQDGLNNLTVINGDINSSRLRKRQFDAIIVNGVLEWVALFDLSLSPTAVQLRFLRTLRELLADGGKIYIGIENRIGWAQWYGDRDHSGLRYTSLLPRFLARWVCAHSKAYRSKFNTGYRTYTYTYGGYDKLFRRAGLQIRSVYVSPNTYNLPTELIPIQQAAIEHYIRNRMLRPNLSYSDRIRNAVKLLMGREWFWRTFGSDFVFVLEARDA